jgi:hypothetical protein
MPGLFASLTGVPVVACRLTVLYSGIWHADVMLDRAPPAPLVGPQVLALAGSTWACAVVQVGDYAGVRKARLVGGTGGWRRPVLAPELPPPFVSPLGVPIALVLAAAAGLARELPVNLAGYIGSPLLGSPPLGGAYVFQAGPMSLVLHDLLGDDWWIDATGQVQVAPVRPPVPIVSPWTCTDFDGSKGTYEIATDSPADWVPGAVFVGPTVQGSVSRVTHHLDGTKLRSVVIGPPS